LISKAACVLSLLKSAPALAHSNTGEVGGLVSGFEHPFLGADHLLAMVAVGIWGAFLGRPLVYLLPVIFPLMMAVGAVLGIFGVQIPPTETGIAVSMIVLGAAIGCAMRAPVAVAVGLISVFALFHGYAHGTELPFALNPQPYIIGFVLATGLLHVAGILLGMLRRRRGGTFALRAIGGGISFAGLAFLLRLISA
jgi:urease accessory protein